MSRDLTIGIVGIGLVAQLLLVYALFGNPPYALYSVLKVAVAVATATSAGALYVLSKRYLPISFGLVLIGGIHLFGKMRRLEWVPFNWAGVVGLALAVVILMISVRGRVGQRPNQHDLPCK
jgi:hypothetical protein